MLFDLGYAGTYDVQSVGVLLSNESNILTCTFIRGSQSQGCKLTICQEIDNGTTSFEQTPCRNVTIARDQNHRLSTKTLTGFTFGLSVTIRQVIEIERDGSETAHRFLPDFDIVPPIVPVHASTTTDLDSSEDYRRSCIKLKLILLLCKLQVHLVQ